MSPLVSVIIPVYNAENWVAETLGSVLSQTWPEIEAIAVNDGSTDNSMAVLRRISDRRVRILEQPNRGAAAARNAGIAAAKGDYIQFLDADDLMAPDKIAVQMAALLRSDDDSVATGRWGRFKESPKDVQPEESSLFADLSPVEFLVRNTRSGEMMHPAAWLLPARVVRAAGPWNESLTLNDDGEYFARIVLKSASVRFVPEAMTFYRSGLPVSLSGIKGGPALKSLFDSCDLIASHLLAAEDSPRVRAALADYFQRLSYELYPGDPKLHREAAQRVLGFGGSAVRPVLGRKRALVASFLGWKSAKRLFQNRGK